MVNVILSLGTLLADSSQNVPTIPEVTLPALLIVPVVIGGALLFLMQRSRSRARRRRAGRPPS